MYRTCVEFVDGRIEEFLHQDSNIQPGIIFLLCSDKHTIGIPMSSIKKMETSLEEDE